MAFGTPTTLGSTTYGTTVASYAHTTTASVAAGERAFIAGYWASTLNTERTATVADNAQGLTWVQDHKVFMVDVIGYSLVLFSAHAPAGLTSGAVITFTLSGNAQGANLAAFKLSGVASSSPVDMVDGASDGAPADATWDTTASSTTDANTMLIGVAAADGSNSDPGAPGGAFTELIDINSVNDWAMNVAWDEVSSAGSYNFTGNWTGTPNFQQMELIAAYKSDGPPAAPVVIPSYRSFPKAMLRKKF